MLLSELQGPSEKDDAIPAFTVFVRKGLGGGMERRELEPENSGFGNLCNPFTTLLKII